MLMLNLIGNIAEKIPRNLWHHYIYRSGDFVIPTKEDWKTVKREDLPENSDAAFIVFLITYPKIPVSELFAFATNILGLKHKEIFIFSAALGYSDILQYIKDQIPTNEFLELVQADTYKAFRFAAANGYLNTLKWFKEVALEQFQDMIQAEAYDAFIEAANNGHFDILKWFKEEAPDTFQGIVKEYGLWLLIQAVFDKYVNISKWLLHYPYYLAHAESHTHEYESIVLPFIKEQLSVLHEEQTNRLIEHPHEVFNLHDVERAKHCFYIVRHLIRRNERDFDDALRFLLAIPAVRNIAHQALDGGEDNQLLRLAVSIGNHVASSMLLDIEAVRTLAVQHDYYSQEAQGILNLSQLAQDRESSMTALSVGEEKRLASAITRYQPKIKELGATVIMRSLRERLIERYSNNPATITDATNQVITLPYEYEGFKALNLQGTDYENALKAYYQHPDHTALRYLSKPNAWMHPDAAYVLGTQGHAYANFEDYQPLIALYYLAVLDDEIGNTQGDTRDQRLEHFINELSLIGRAHNWDKTRICNGQEEEYDDLDADRPSCYSGVKRRLFQSVLGHPLLHLFTADTLLHELRTFARDYFLSVLTKDRKPLLKEAYDEYIMTLDINEEQAALFQSMNIPEHKQKEFHEFLTQKYGEQYTQDVAKIILVKKYFELDSQPHAQLSDRYHFLKLDGLTQITKELNKKPTSPSRKRFFSQRETSDSDDVEPDNSPPLKRLRR